MSLLFSLLKGISLPFLHIHNISQKKNKMSKNCLSSLYKNDAQLFIKLKSPHAELPLRCPTNMYVKYSSWIITFWVPSETAALVAITGCQSPGWLAWEQRGRTVLYNEQHTTRRVRSVPESTNKECKAQYLHWFHCCVPSRDRMKAEEWNERRHNKSHTAWDVVANSALGTREILLKDFLPSLPSCHHHLLRQLCDLQLAWDSCTVQTPNICQAERRCLGKGFSKKDQG